MPRKKRLILRVFSLFLACIFVMQELCSAQGFEPAAVKSAPLQSLCKNPSLFEPPLEFSSLKEIYSGTNNSLIILIEDAHSNFSGQENLANTLDAIMKKYGVSLVLAEGGADDCTLEPLKKLAPPNVWKKVAKSYLRQGKIAGEEYLNLISNHPMKIMGLEDIPLYLKSLKNYATLAEKREENLKYLMEIRTALTKLKKKYYPKGLLEYEYQGRRIEDRNFEASFKTLIRLAVSLRGGRSRRSNLIDSTDTQIAALPTGRQASTKSGGLAMTHVDSDVFSDFPNIQKFITLQQKESQINFELANLEQAALLEEIDKHMSSSFPQSLSGNPDTETNALSGSPISAEGRIRRRLDGGKAFGDDKTKTNMSLFCHFENTLNIANEKHLVLENYPNWSAYGEYLKEFSNLELDKMLEEFEKLEDEVYRGVIARSPQAMKQSNLQLAQIAALPTGRQAPAKSRGLAMTSDVKDALLIRSIDRYLNLLESAYHIQMTTQEFEMFEANEPDFSTLAYQAFINRKLAELGYFEDLIPYQHIFEEDKKYLKDFYSSVSERDLAFMKNMENVMDHNMSSPQSFSGDQTYDPRLKHSGVTGNAAVMIAGGYHTQHLKQLLQAKGYSYIVLTPNVTQETNQAKYEQELLAPIKKDIKTISVGIKEHVSREKPLSSFDIDLFQTKKKNDDLRAASLGLAFFEENQAEQFMTPDEIQLRLAMIQKYIDLAKNLVGESGVNLEEIKKLEDRFASVSAKLKARG